MDDFLNFLLSLTSIYRLLRTLMLLQDMPEAHFFSSYAVTSLHIDYGTLILLCTVTKRCVLFFECVNDYTIIKQQGCK